MNKWIERAAWITGSLGLAGVVLIFFLQGMERVEPRIESSHLKPHVVKRKYSKPTIVKKIETPVQTNVPQPDPVQAKPTEKETETIEIKKPETTPLVVKPKEKPVPKPQPEVYEKEEATTSAGSLFAESELNQLIGKIQAAQFKTNSVSNCVQIRITANNNNASSVSQVERFLTNKGYVIIGREKEDFLRGTGLAVYAQGRCAKVTIGKK